MVKRWLRGICGGGPENICGNGITKAIKRVSNRLSRSSQDDIFQAMEQLETEGGEAHNLEEEDALSDSNSDEAESDDNNKNNNNNDVTSPSNAMDDDDDDSLDPLNEYASTHVRKPFSDDASLDGTQVFDPVTPIPRPKKKFLEAALQAKSLSDLGYVHVTEPSNASKWKSMTDLKYEGENESLGDDELFEQDEPIPTKKKFLEAALAAKSVCDIKCVSKKKGAEEEGPKDQNDSNNSLDSVEIFDLGSPIVHSKKMFLDAALAAKSLSDLDYVHATEPSNGSKWKSMTDLKYDGEDSSLGDSELFEEDEPIPAKKKFLDAALAAKSISDLSTFISSAKGTDVETNQDSDLQDSDLSHSSSDSLGHTEILPLGSPIVRPKKRFLETALMVKSLSNINYIHADQGPAPRRKSLTDLKYADEQSLGDNELFEDDEEPPTKNQFLDAALAAKSISDINFVFSAAHKEQEEPPDDNESSSGSIDFYTLDAPAVSKKKPSILAKSMSDFRYVHSNQAPKASRRKSMTDLDYDDDRSLGRNELFDLDNQQIIRPKKKFLEAALMAKSISDLKFIHLNKSTYSSSVDSESRDDTTNVVPEHLLGLSQPYLFHSSDLNSIDNDELFESLTEEPIERPILKAALEAKAQQEEGIIVVGSRDAPTTFSNVSSEIVPEHLMVVNQPATDHAHDNYSIEVEDIFERPSGEQYSKKPLLKAALEAQAQLEEEELVENLAKSMSHLGADEFLKPSAAFHQFSRSVPDFSIAVPDHLAVVNQPKRDFPTLDELSIDGDRLFDSPQPKGRKKKLLLEAALRAKRVSTKTEVSTSEGESLAA